jgi:hypothetical protein
VEDDRSFGVYEVNPIPNPNPSYHFQPQP